MIFIVEVFEEVLTILSDWEWVLCKQYNVRPCILIFKQYVCIYTLTCGIY